MPRNYFLNREERSKHPSQVKIGDLVFIVAKEDQGTKDFNKLYFGAIQRVLSSGDGYEKGFKINLQIIDKGYFNFQKYYEECIMTFTNPQRIPWDKVNEFYEFMKTAKYTDKYIVGRIQYFALPKEFKPKPRIKSYTIGIYNNDICDIPQLEKEVQFIRSNYTVLDKDFAIQVEALFKYRNLNKVFSAEQLERMNYKKNYIKITISEEKYLEKSELLFF